MITLNISNHLKAISKSTQDYQFEYSANRFELTLNLSIYCCRTLRVFIITT